MTPTCTSCGNLTIYCHCLKAMNSPRCSPAPAVMRGTYAQSEQAQMADGPGARRSASGEAHEAIEKMQAENSALHHRLAQLEKELYGTHEALDQARRDLRVAQDFAIQLTQRIERTGR